MFDAAVIYESVDGSLGVVVFVRSPEFEIEYLHLHPSEGPATSLHKILRHRLPGCEFSISFEKEENLTKDFMENESFQLNMAGFVLSAHTPLFLRAPFAGSLSSEHVQHHLGTLQFNLDGNYGEEANTEGLYRKREGSSEVRK